MQNKTDKNKIKTIDIKDQERFNEIKNEYQSLALELGIIEIQLLQLQKNKQQLLDMIVSNETKQAEFYKILEAKYGPGTLDANTFEFTPATTTDTI